MNSVSLFFKREKIRNIGYLLLPDLVFWTAAVVLTYFSVDWSKVDVDKLLLELAYVYIPLSLAMYIHAILFSYTFLRKKYLLYVVLAIIFYTIAYYATDWFYLIHVPKRRGDILINIIFFAMVYLGFRYLVNAPREILKMKEAEAKRLKAENDLQILEAKHSKAELELLKSQVNPHFLFNSLNNIYSLTLTDAAKAGNSILTLSDLMRYNLESSKKKYVTLQHEIEFINNYISLEAIRLAENCNIIVEADSDFSGKLIAPMILISFVENCFKHGIGANNESYVIKISMRLEDDLFIFSTENQIVPPRMDTNKKEINIGLENVKKRLELMYKDKYELQILKENGIYRVDLKILL